MSSYTPDAPAFQAREGRSPRGTPSEVRRAAQSRYMLGWARLVSVTVRRCHHTSTGLATKIDE